MVDLAKQFWAMNHTPEKERERFERRRARKANVYDKLKGIIAETRMAEKARVASGWALESLDQHGDGQSIGNMHPGVVAVRVVREVLASLALPSTPTIHFVRMRREAGHGAHGIDDGYVDVNVTFKTLGGVQRWFDVPVRVNAGRVLSPSILYDAMDHPRIITQHSIDDMVRGAQFDKALSARRSMFSPPPDKGAVMPRVPIVSGGMFAVASKSKSLRVGNEVRLSDDLEVRDRGGSVWHLDKGTKGKVRRDMQERVYVHFFEAGFSAPVPRELLEG